MRYRCGSCLCGLAAAACFAQSQGTPGVSLIAGAAGTGDWWAGVPQGSIFSVYGTSLAPSVAQPAMLPLPTVLNGVRVRLWADYPPKTQVGEAPLLYVSPGQINAILPSGVPIGTVYATVAVAALESQAASIEVTQPRFTPFAMNSAGSGPAAIQQVDATGYPWLNRLSAPAVPGQPMTLWGTGLGALPSGSDADPPAAGDLRSDVTVLVAGIPAATLYAGRAPGLPGVDQINFLLPEKVPLRCFVPLVVRTGTAASGLLTLAASADSAPCRSEFGLSAAALASLDGGGVVRGAVLSVTTATSAANGAVAQQTEAWMAEYDAASLSVLANADLLPLGDPGGVCSRRSYTLRLHMPGPLLEAGIYGLRRISGWMSGSCLGAVTNTDGVVQGGGCASPYDFAGSLGSAATAFHAAGTLPAARAASDIGGLKVEGGSVAWTAAAPGASDRIVITTGSQFSYGGNIFGYTAYVNDLACQVAADRTSAGFPPAELTWAQAKGSNTGYSAAIMAVSDQLFAPGESGLDFVLVRSRTSTVVGQ